MSSSGVKVESGVLQIYFLDLVAGLDQAQKRKLAELLVWDEDIFTELVRDLTSGISTRSYQSLVYQARIQLLELLPEMSQEIVRSLMHELEANESERRRLDEWSWKLYHCHREARMTWIDVPGLPPFVTTRWKDHPEIAAEVLEKYGYAWKEGQWQKVGAA